MKLKIRAILPILVFSVLLSSCSKSLGYSVVLWGNEEHQLLDGTIVKVYIKSNISHVYVASLPDSKEKMEFPLWQLTEPGSKKEALQQQKRFSEYKQTFASVKLDGLPIRADAVNTAKQVYRLREKEIIKVLYKGKGAAVTNGKGNMSGEWLRVLTSTGTIGWCFSYNLELFNSEYGEKEAVQVTENATSANSDKYLENLLAKKWYPEYFGDMIKARRISLTRMSPEYGFDFGEVSGTIHLVTENANKQWTFNGIKKIGERQYQFEGTQVQVTGHANGSITVQYMDTDGKTKAHVFVALSENIAKVVENELFRRQDELKKIASAGPQFKSSSYGTITFNNESQITWNNYNLLIQQGLIEKSAIGSATVSIEYFLSNSLKSSYDGVITIHFYGTTSPVTFLYKMTPAGLRLEDATKATIRDEVVTGRSASPLIMFFEAK